MPGGGEGHGNQPTATESESPRVAGLTHLDDDGGGHAERNRRQQLIGDAEQRPERIDAAQRIFDALPEKISPGGTITALVKRIDGIPTGAAQRLPDVAEGVLHHEAADAGAGIEMVRMNSASNMMAK